MNALRRLWHATVDCKNEISPSFGMGPFAVGKARRSRFGFHPPRGFVLRWSFQGGLLESPERARRHPNFAGEHVRQVTLVREAASVGDFGQRTMVLKKLLGQFKSLSKEPLVG